jgi:hypothetical protein
MSEKTKFAYLAGIIDGEGCLSIGAGRRQKWGVVNYNSIVSVANTDIRLIKWLHQNFGGNFFDGKQQRPNNKKHYIWRLLKRKDIEVLLLAVLPYLIVKREQAIVLLELVRLPSTENPVKRQALWEKMAVLNKRGVGVTTNTSSELVPAQIDQLIVDALHKCHEKWVKEGLVPPYTDSKIESGLTGDRESDPAVTQEPVTPKA